MTWLLVVLLLQFPDAPPGRATGSIEGTVVDDVTGAPVRRASVSIFPLPQQSVTAVTDAGGHFAIQNLPPGRYVLDASHPDYPRGRSQGPAIQELVLAEGEQKQGITIRLRPGAALSGHVTDEDDEPMGGCTVQLYARNHQSRAHALIPFAGTNTGEHGQYRIEHLLPGTYYARAVCNREAPVPHPLRPVEMAPPEGELYYRGAWYPAAADFAGASAIKAPAGADIGQIDFKLRPERTYWIQGRVEGAPDAATLRLLSIKLVRRGASGWPGIDQPSWGFRASTGTFSIRGVLPGSYDLVASGGGSAYFASQPLEVRDSSIDGITLALSKAPDLSGRIEIPAEGSAVPKAAPAHINLQPGDLNPVLFGPASAPVTPDGAFELKAVYPGRYAVQVQPLPLNGYVQSVWLGNREMPPDNVQIPEGAAGRLRVVVSLRAGQLDATLLSDPGSASTPFVFAVAGPDTPVNQDSPPVAGQQNGRFTWRGLAPGHYRVYALPAADWALLRDFDFLDALKSYSAEATIEEGKQASVQVPLIPPDVLARIQKEIE